jgi:copper homeostasis protein
MPTNSGQSKSALAGLPVLRELLRRSQSTGGPVILPGAGINHGTICHVMDHLLPHGLKEVHLSGGRWVDGGMDHRPEGMGMGASAEGQWGVWRTDGDAIREVRRIADDSAKSANLTVSAAS